MSSKLSRTALEAYTDMRFSAVLILLWLATVAVLSVGSGSAVTRASEVSEKVPLLQPNSLCLKTERSIFSCLTTRAGAKSVRGPSKIVSLCASSDLDKEQGYLQYRYGLPGKVELEYPNSQTGTQQMFRYTHYMRYQVDRTEIDFDIDGYQYQIFDEYNGEEKPRISRQGISVTAPSKSKEVTFVCRTKAKADYSTLDEVLKREQ